MRELIKWLTTHHFRGKQVAFCEAVNLQPAYVSKYKSGKGSHGQMLLSQLDARHHALSAAIAKAQLPTEVPETAAAVDATASAPNASATNNTATTASVAATSTSTATDISGA